MTGDARERHPVGQLTEILGRVPRYLALARSLIGDPTVPRWRKAALAAGLEEGDIARDLAIVRRVAGWLARGAARTTVRAGRTAARAGVRTAKVLGRTAAAAVRSAGRAADAARKRPR